MYKIYTIFTCVTYINKGPIMEEPIQYYFLPRCLVILSASLIFFSSATMYANTVVFSPRTLQWKAIGDGGKVVRTGHASGGRGYCPDIHRSCRTPTGTYHVISKSGPSCRSTRYPVGKGGAPMPYCMFFSKYYAIHGSPDVPRRNASHGCIRVPPSDARWLNQNFVRIGTRVVVTSY